MEDLKYTLNHLTSAKIKTDPKKTGLAEIIATIVITGIATATAIGAGIIINSLDTDTINRAVYNHFYPQYTLK